MCACGYASVRRRHPLLVNFRRTRKVMRAVAFLIFHVIFLLVLSGATAGLIMVFERDLRVEVRATPAEFVRAVLTTTDKSARARSWIDAGGVVLFIAIPMVAVAAGIWLRAALAFWRWPRQFIAWAILVSCWVWLETLVWPLTWLHGRLSREPAVYSGHSPKSSAILLGFIGIVLVLTVAASPLGRLVLRMIEWNRRGRFRKQLNRRRRVRRGE